MHYRHKFNSAWASMYPWLKESKKGQTFFYCKPCGKDLCGRTAAVKKHEVSTVHTKKCSSAKTQMWVVNFIHKHTLMEKQTKEIEIRIASFLVEHNVALFSADHLTDLIKKHVLIFLKQLSKFSWNEVNVQPVYRKLLVKRAFKIYLQG